ncbi:hypothetical protein V6N12_074356 [Hibiscus sabdariffa]|uniref:Uncharacterized protein n=1 Tax=Hibiscus sabdariffa TaxID=183260 RepID=A0ABR2BL59_9ROSI
MRERLDQGVANGEWWEMFPNFSLIHLTFSLHRQRVSDQDKRHSLFESVWLMDESCEEEVKRLWETSSASVLNRLQFVRNGFNNLRR